MSFRLLEFKDIPIRIHWSFTLLFIGIVIAQAILQDIQTGVLWGLGILALFISVIIHEFMHSYAAYRFGYPTEEIVLYPLGGASKIREIPTKPKQEFTIAIVGPITNFIIAGIVALVLVSIGSFDFSLLGRQFSNLLEYYALLNLSLGLFNMFVPALPMDGGRLLRSILNTRMPFPRATMISVRISNIIAIMMAFVGLFYNVWLVFIALFLYVTSSSEMEESITRYLLEDVPVEDIVNSDIKHVQGSEPVNLLIDLMLDTGHLGYLVKDEQDRSIGVVTLEDVRRTDPQQRDELQISDIMTEQIRTIEIHQSAKEALLELQQNDIGRLFVKDDGEIVGIITRSDIVKYLKISTLKGSKTSRTIGIPEDLQSATPS